MKEDKRELLVRISYLYYIKGYTQQQIAQELNIYRTTISRFLKEAQQEQIVSIQIVGYDPKLFELELRIKALTTLKKVVIVPNFPTETEKQKDENLSKKAAQYLKSTIKPHSTVGFAWGKNLAGMVGQLRSFKNTNSLFVPLVGGPSRFNAGYHPNSIVYNFAHQLGGQSLFINETAIQPTAYQRTQLYESLAFKKIFRAWEQLDIAFVGIGGSLKSKGSHWRDLLTATDIVELTERGAVGDCCCTFFDKNGEILSGQLLNRTVSIPIRMLQKVPTVVGVARSLDKVNAIAAILKMNLLDVLILDELTAQRLVTLLADR